MHPYIYPGHVYKCGDPILISAHREHAMLYNEALFTLRPPHRHRLLQSAQPWIA